MHLTIVDTAGIQSYVFGSNRLRENVGASYLVAQATGDWALEAVRDTLGTTNVTTTTVALDTSLTIESGLDAEVLYARGGNAVLIVKDETALVEFERALSTRVLVEAPGLHLVVAHVPFKGMDKEPLAVCVDTLFRRLAEIKRDWVSSVPLLGLGVTVPCGSTGLPALALTVAMTGDDAEVVDDSFPASAEILAKRAAFPKAGKRLADQLPPGAGFVYPRDFDDLGRTEGVASHLAVVHADGNGMGARIQALADDFRTPDLDPDATTVQNRAYVNRLRAFSDGVDAAAQAAQASVFGQLSELAGWDGGVLRHIVNIGDEKSPVWREAVRIELKRAWQARRATTDWYLPFRPLIFGGDDLTFVCDGRLGLALAVAYLRAFEKATEGLGDASRGLTAGAGVAIVGTHYPFARAYRLVGELAHSAKSLRSVSREKDENDGKEEWDASVVDWHHALGGLSGSLDEIRRREYQSMARTRAGTGPPYSLVQRPVAVGKAPLKDEVEETTRTWEVEEMAILAFQSGTWGASRNTAKALRDVLREGPDHTEAFTAAFRPLPDLGLGLPGLEKKGHDDVRCVYFDALELMDVFIPPSIFGQSQKAASSSTGTDDAAPADAAQ